MSVQCSCQKDSSVDGVIDLVYNVSYIDDTVEFIYDGVMVMIGVLECLLKSLNSLNLAVMNGRRGMRN